MHLGTRVLPPVSAVSNSTHPLCRDIGFDLLLGRTYGGILDFSFGGRTENGHDMALELVSGADFRVGFSPDDCDNL